MKLKLFLIVRSISFHTHEVVTEINDYEISIVFTAQNENINISHDGRRSLNIIFQIGIPFRAKNLK